MPSNKLNTKIFETQINKLLYKYILAYTEDKKTSYPIDLPAHVSGKADDYYNNLLETKLRDKSCKNIITISTDVKQIIAKIFESTVNEINNLEQINKTGDILREVINECDTLNNNSVVKYIFEFTIANDIKSGSILEKAYDRTSYFHSRFEGYCPILEANKKNLGTVSAAWDDFLKSLAIDIATTHWYNPTPLNRKLFLGILARSVKMDDILIIELNDSIREPVKSKKTKTVKKPKKKNTKSENEDVESEKEDIESEKEDVESEKEDVKTEKEDVESEREDIESENYDDDYENMV